MPGVLALAQVLALAAAFTSAVATVLIRQGLRSGTPYAGFYVNLVVGTALLWAVMLWRGPSGPIELRGVAFFVLAGLIGTVAGRLLRFVAIDKVGASVSAALNNMFPFVAAILAIVVLGERVTPAIAVGTVVIVVGAILLSGSSRRVGFARRDLVYPILSATCFGVVSILRKIGLGQMGPIEGFTVNVTTALVAFSAFLFVSGTRGALACDRRGLAYFALAGVTENASVFMLLLALQAGTVSVVTPLSGTAPVFALLLSYLFLRGIETLTWSMVAGTVAIVAGVYLITAL